MEAIFLFVIPILMLSSFYLANCSNRLRLDVYSKHVVFEIDELKPSLENDVNNHNLFKIKDYSFIILIGLLLFWARYRVGGSYLYEWACGLFLITFLRVNALHLYNIFIYKFIRENPGEIKGQITQSARYYYTAAAAQDFEFLLAIAPLALLIRSFYLYGALTGAVIISGTKIHHYQKIKKKKDDNAIARKKTGLLVKCLRRCIWVVPLAYLIAYEGYQIHLNKIYSIQEIDAAFEPITNKYGIKIVYEIGDDFFSPLENPPIPAGPPRYSKVIPIRHRVLIEYPDILQKAFNKYPVKVIKNHLNAIYFAREIDIAGRKAGGTYDPFRRIIYLVDNGDKNDDQAISTFHHEFSSLLMNQYSFLIDSWTDHNPRNYKYLYNTTDDPLKMYNSSSLVGTKEDYEKGFMNSYGQTCFGNDFNEYSAMIFTYPEKFKKIMNQYPRVQGKYKVWLEFYQKIDPIFTEEYLFGKNLSF